MGATSNRSGTLGIVDDLSAALAMLDTLPKSKEVAVAKSSILMSLVLKARNPRFAADTARECQALLISNGGDMNAAIKEVSTFLVDRVTGAFDNQELCECADCQEGARARKLN